MRLHYKTHFLSLLSNKNRKPVLTSCGASVDWKCSSTPITDICSSHLRLVSLPSSWYSPALLNRHRNATNSCSASVHRAAVAAWQKITSRRSCRDVSGGLKDSGLIEGVQGLQTLHCNLPHYTCLGVVPMHMHYSISWDPLRGYFPLTSTICHHAQLKGPGALCALTPALGPVKNTAKLASTWL